MKRTIFPYDAGITIIVEIIIFGFVITKKAREFEYLDTNVGFWTPHTANVDWCEVKFLFCFFFVF